MARLTGLGRLLGITAGVFLLLRVLHVATPVIFPATRQGPIDVAALADVRPQVGFAPLLPAYRPAVLGTSPPHLRIWLSPVPAVESVWLGPEHDLTVTQRRGGPAPAQPPLARPLDDLPDTAWWIADGRSHLTVRRGDFWIEFDTSLPARDLRRFLDTLTAY